MANTSMRNSLHRRNHKERAQPLNRARLGLLEKHKDYVHRARDYKSKRERIKKLKEKAAFRNKDEFYFGMVKGKTMGGVAIGDRGNEALSTDVVKILKTQDVGYVKLQIAQDEKKISKLRAELEVTAPVAGPSEWNAASELAEVEKLAEMGIVIRPQEIRPRGKGKAKEAPAGHMVFVDDREELFNYGKTPQEPSQIVTEEEPVDLGWITVEPKRKTKKPAPPPPPAQDEEETIAEAKTYRMDLLTNLSALLARIKLLRQAEARLETTKSLMGKGGARKVREAGFVEDENAPEDWNGNKTRYEGKMWKWKLERKR